MDAFFLDPQVPHLPPEETRILDLRAEPYSDGKRVHVNLKLTPFLPSRPSAAPRDRTDTHRSRRPDLRLRQCH